MMSITKDIEFDAAHRLLGHDGLCANLHGHRYRASITVGSKVLDGLGRVVDFAEVKRLVGGWIAEHWDHACLVGEQDTALLEFLYNEDQRVYVFNFPPTAEVMARVLHKVAVMALPHLTIQSVKVWETPTSCAEYRE